MINFGGLFFQDRWTMYVLEGGKGKGVVFIQKSPPESKYNANSNRGEVWSERYLEEAEI